MMFSDVLPNYYMVTSLKLHLNMYMIFQQWRGLKKERGAYLQVDASVVTDY